MEKSECKIKIVRNDGKTFDLVGALADKGDWIITELSGIDLPNFSNNTQKQATEDGSMLLGTSIDSRSIRIKANVRNKGLNAISRRIALQFFNIKYTYSIYITYHNTERWIDGIIDGISIPSLNVYKQQEIDVTFWCEKPYFKSVDNYGKNIAAITSLLAFPYIQTDKIPIVASTYNFARSVDISNDGDVDTFMEVIMKIQGDVTNPMIYKDEKFVKILGTFHDNDIITIDMINLKVQLNGENALHLIDKNSSFTDCNISVGDNTISFDADDGHDYMEVVIYYNKLYNGI